jgi:U3 small nucleolar RNA-associated protein 4
MCVTLSPCASPSSVIRGPQSGDSKNVKVINPLASNAVPTFEDGVYRRVAYPTGLAPAITLARRADLVVTTKDNSVSIWRIQRKASGEDAGYPTLKTANMQDDSAYEKLLDMDLYVTTNICASAISEDGRWLAVSDVYETKLFKLRDTVSCTYSSISSMFVHSFSYICYRTRLPVRNASNHYPRF